jgi:SAM-dependent methyltransferase
VLNHAAAFGRCSGKLLEFGCEYGFLLSEAARRYTSVGVDVSAAALAHCRAQGLLAYHPTDPAWESCAPYDVIVIFGCIEHLADPEAVLGGVRGTSANGSVLVLTTGDWSSLYARVSRSHWRLMTPATSPLLLRNNDSPIVGTIWLRRRGRRASVEGRARRAHGVSTRQSDAASNSTRAGAQRRWFTSQFVRCNASYRDTRRLMRVVSVGSSITQYHATNV